MKFYAFYMFSMFFYGNLPVQPLFHILILLAWHSEQTFLSQSELLHDMRSMLHVHDYLSFTLIWHLDISSLRK